MTIFERIKSFFGFGKREQVELSNPATDPYFGYDMTNPYPTTPPYTLTSDNKRLQEPDYARAWFPQLRQLASFNQDVSLAVDNIKDLASQKFEVVFSGASNAQQTKMRAFLEIKYKEWYPYSTGITSLVNDLIRQLATYGVISAEPILDSRLKDIQRISLVNPYQIYFSLEKDGNYRPYQKLEGSIFTGLATAYIPLNPFTYKYITLERDGSSPYPLPPLLSALESLGVQRNALNNVSKITQKFGLFGFLSVLLAPLKPKPAETPENYEKRSIAHLQAEGNRIRNQKNDSLAVGYKDSHEINLQGSGVDGKNAQDIMKVLDTLVMAGIKQDPAMMGREKNTSEAFGRILLEKFTAKITTYQSLVASFLESIFLLALRLQGYKLDGLTVVFREPRIADELKKEQTNTAKIDNLIKLYNQGIISQETIALEMGYDTPFLPEPITITKPVDNPPVPDQAIQNLKEKIANAKLDLYRIPIAYEGEANPPTPYSNQIEETYLRATKQIARKIKTDLEKVKNKMTLAELQDKVFATLVIEWERRFKGQIESTIDSQVEKYYARARKDKSIFAKTKSNSFDKIPDAVFDTLDKRTIEFLKLMDNFYLGKFITDEDTKRRLYEYLRKTYIESDTPIGDNEEQIQKIKEAFQEVMGLESYKIRRIIDTSINRMRAFGNLNFMSQAKVETYQIVEVMDQITCPYCKHLNGKEFSVSTSRNRLSNLLSGEPEDVKTEFPFATVLSITEFEKLDTEALEKLNITMPSFHPHCRGRLVGKF